LRRSVCLDSLHSPRSPIKTRVYKVVGLPESEVDERIAPIYKNYANPTTSLLAVPGTLKCILRARTATEVDAEALLTELAIRSNWFWGTMSSRHAGNPWKKSSAFIWP